MTHNTAACCQLAAALLLFVCTVGAATCGSAPGAPVLRYIDISGC